MSAADTEFLVLLAWPVLAAVAGWIIAVLAVNLDFVLDHRTRDRRESVDR